jgi:hypothetical protein
MKLHDIPFHTLDWSALPVQSKPGETGLTEWREYRLGEIGVRMVKYSPGYKADHWCNKGHLILCLDGQFDSELGDGRTLTLKAGMCYFVADDTMPHRSSTATGATLYIID